MRDLAGKALQDLTAEDILYLAQRNRLTSELIELLDEDNLSAAMRGEEPLAWDKPKKPRSKKPKNKLPKNPVNGTPMVPKHAPEHGVVHVTREGSIMDKMPSDLYDPAWTNDHLRHECHIRGLSMDGRKDQLITRLLQFDELVNVAEQLPK